MRCRRTFRHPPSDTKGEITRTKPFRAKFLLLIVATLTTFVFANIARAQVEPPDRDFLFFEDQVKKKEEKKRKRTIETKAKRLRSQQSKQELPLDINAPTINFDSAGRTVYAEGGLIIANGPTIIEADKGSFNIDTHDLELSGNVRITDLTGDLLADAANFNMDSGKGKLVRPRVFFAEGGYRVWAEEAEKLGAEDYLFKDATLSTCFCAEDEDCRPWSINADEAKITKNGYGQVWDASLAVHDVPALYVPYLIFPAKTERQSGLLPATFGGGKENGFGMMLPLYLVFDRSSDATLTSILQTNTRVGLQTEYRQAFSARNQIETGMTFLDESARGDDLQGTNLDGLADPELKSQRFAGYLKQNAGTTLLGHRFQTIVDGRYVNDDLILREFEQPKIGEYNSRFLTSRAVLRTGLSEDYSFDLTGEYSQAMVDDDRIIFQKVPDARVSGLHIFRPFGENPLGAKAVLENTLNSTYFYRQKGYHGVRNEVYERLKIPFHFMNYFEAEAGGDVRGSLYELDDARTARPQNNGDIVIGEPIDSSSDRLVPGANFKIGTVFEKVMDVEEGNPIKTIGELGSLGRDYEFKRVKHTLEPSVKYRFVPFVSQEENPQFDANDRLERRNVVTYELAQRLFSKFEPRNPFRFGIEEATPELEDIPELGATGPIDDKLSFGIPQVGGATHGGLGGKRSEFARLTLSQSLDIDRERDGPDPTIPEDDQINSFSDVAIGILLLPNEYVRLRSLSNLNVEDPDFDSYGVEAQLTDKRGDELRTRLTFVTEQIRQLESGLEVVLTDRLKVGYYSRYDDINGEVIESKIGVRRTSSCNCWNFDVQYANRLNPDEKSVLFTVTLAGLGEVTDRLFSDQFTRRSETPAS